jgi:sarcosine oxidase subunit alpha
MRRLPHQPGESIDRNRAITFECDGRSVSGYEGDTIASALSAAGRRIFSRSFKYHRPRGLLCVSGKCPNCLMNVNGVPNVRTCTELARDGMRVQSQNCWPSADRDYLSVVQRLDFALPVGFYYKLFARPRWAWRTVEPFIRRMAGLGRILPDAPEEHYEHVHLECDVAVVGGGPSGMSAALASADGGTQVYLIDDQAQLGGHLRYHNRVAGQPDQTGFQIAEGLAARVQSHPGIQVFRRAVAFGAYEGGLLAVQQGNSLIHLRSAKLIVAAGAYEYPPCFSGNDLPGIMLASGVRRLIHLYGVQPGRTAVLCGCDDETVALALDLVDRGIEVRAVGDTRTGVSGAWARALERAGIPLFTGTRVVAARGRNALESVELSSSRSLGCDLLVLATQYAGSLELLRQSGVACEYDETLHQFIPVEHPAGIFSAGRMNGVRDLNAELLSGELAGRQAASGSVPEIRRRLDTLESTFRETPGSRGPLLLPDAGMQFVCFCEDVKQADISAAVREGFNELETLKRYSTVSMGPCQGRMCLMNASTLCAQRTGKKLAGSKSTTARPPVQPVPLGLLAGPHHNPVKLSPMHYRHMQAGAKQMDMGPWKRPHTYTSQEEEWRAVREAAGIIDLSTLGKLELRGKDAGAFLDKVYTHNFSRLKPGRVRYGVICNDEGIILDDGTVSRLAESRYFITTTTGNVDFVERWLAWWLAGAGVCAHVTNVTGDYAAVNVAGPRSRDTLRKLTDTDLSPGSFEYMMCREAEIAGVPAVLLRIGFVGETGWEIHYPSCYGEYLWDAILEAGSEYGIRPFGVETQRILRLEKKHAIVGHDTDALSNLLDADMAWCAKFDKEDFIGRPGLEFLGRKPREQKLIGFVAETNVAIAEGSVVLHNSKPVGRVTSCRVSPYLHRAIGMAWVPETSSGADKQIHIRSNGSLLAARVVEEAFYDPEGRRLRE